LILFIFFSLALLPPFSVLLSLPLYRFIESGGGFLQGLGLAGVKAALISCAVVGLSSSSPFSCGLTASSTSFHAVSANVVVSKNKRIIVFPP
jgi:hypothetical protein